METSKVRRTVNRAIHHLPWKKMENNKHLEMQYKILAIQDADERNNAWYAEMPDVIPAKKKP